MSERKKLYLLVAVSLVLLCSGCSYYHETYSVLESVPYLNYGANVTPEFVGGSTNFGIGIGGVYLATGTDADTSVNTVATTMSLRANLGSIVEIGYTPSLSISDEMYPYGILDAKFVLLHEPVIVSPDVGIGMGFGRAGFMGDLRMLMILGLPLLDGQINPYVAPKVMMLLYPYELSGFIPTTKRTMFPIFGLDTGLSFSIPIGGDEKSVQKLKIRPEFTFMAGNEPKGDKIKFSVMQFGASLLYAP